LGLLVCEEVITETRRGKTHVATRWHLKSRHRAPWKWIPPQALVAERGTAVRLKLQNALSPLLDAGFVEAALRRHYQPLFDPSFVPVLAPCYPGGVTVEVNGRALEPEEIELETAPLEIRAARGGPPRRPDAPPGGGVAAARGVGRHARPGRGEPPARGAAGGARPRARAARPGRRLSAARHPGPGARRRAATAADREGRGWRRRARVPRGLRRVGERGRRSRARVRRRAAASRGAARAASRRRFPAGCLRSAPAGAPRAQHPVRGTGGRPGARTPGRVHGVGERGAPRVSARRRLALRRLPHRPRRGARPR